MPKTNPGVLEARRNADLQSLAKGEVGEAIAALGKKGLGYDEAGQVTKAKRDKQKIKAAASLIKCVFAADAQHLNKSQFAELLKYTLHEKAEKLKIKEAHVAAWIEAMSCRYRNLMAHVNQYVKHPASGKQIPACVRDMELIGVHYPAWDSDGGDDDGEDEDEGEDECGDGDEGQGDEENDDEDDDDSES